MDAVKICCISLFELHDLQTPKVLVQDHAPCPLASLNASNATPTYPRVEEKVLWEDRSMECNPYFIYLLQFLHAVWPG